MPWQAYLSDRALECDENRRLIFDRVLTLAARQNGKTEWLTARILYELYVRGSRLSIHTAQDRQLPREVFGKISEIITQNEWLDREVQFIRLTNGQEEIQLKSGSRYKIIAPTKNAARGLSVDGIAIIDELREQENYDLWGAISKTTLATYNPQLILASNAGHSLSVVLNDLRDKGRAAALYTETDPKLLYLEWSASDDRKLDDPEGWAESNPALGQTIKIEKLESAYLTDPPEVFTTEVLCRWVETMRPILPSRAWESCITTDLKIEIGAEVFLAFDISPSRDEAALLAASHIEDRLAVSVVAHWYNPRGIDEVSITKEIAAWASSYSVPVVGYDPRFAWSAAARLEAMGIPIQDIGGVRFYRASQEFFESVTNRRLAHADDPYLNAHIAAAARQEYGDGSWRISRRQSSQSIVAVIALAMAIHLATDPSSGVSIV